MRPCRPVPAILFAAVLAAMPAVLVAQEAPCGPNCLGLFFSATEPTCCTEASPFSVVTAYLVLSEPTFPAISGIAFEFVTEGPVQVLSVFFGSVVICDTFAPGSYCGAWSPALELDPAATVLATCTFLYTGTGLPALIGIRNWGSPEGDLVWAWTDDGAGIPLVPAAGPGRPLAQINGDCGIVRAVGASWGAVKSLYR